MSNPLEFNSGIYNNFQDACEHFIDWFDDGTGALDVGELRYQLEESRKEEPTHYEDALLALSDEDLLNAFRYSRGEESDGVQPIHSIRPRLSRLTNTAEKDYF